MGSMSRLNLAKKNVDAESKKTAGKPWKVVIADDEQGMHDITRQVLAHLTYENRPIRFISAYSGREVRDIMTREPDVAAILLDVVMENEHSGLDVANFIRNTLRNEYTRIILRTGQPGTAPERSIIQEYDINDYKDKTELTATRLYTSVIASLRDYNLLTKLDRCLNGMEKAVDSLAILLRIRNHTHFAESLLKQVLELLNLDESGLFIDASGFTAAKKEMDYTVIAGTGEFADNAYGDGNRSLPTDIQNFLNRGMEKKSHLHENDRFVGYVPARDGTAIRLLYLQGVKDMDSRHRHLIEVFLSHVNVGFDSVLDWERVGQA